VVDKAGNEIDDGGLKRTNQGRFEEKREVRRPEPDFTKKKIRDWEAAQGGGSAINEKIAGRTQKKRRKRGRLLRATAFGRSRGALARTWPACGGSGKVTSPVIREERKKVTMAEAGTGKGVLTGGR